MSSSRALVVVSLLSGLLLLGGCVSDEGTGGSRSGAGGRSLPEPVRTSSSSDSPLSSVEIPDLAAPDERMQIGMDATRALDQFVASDRVVLGEHTTVDMTNTPFLAMSAFTVTPDDVERREVRDDANGLLIITLTNRTGVKTHLPALPQVRIGGLLFVGVEQLVLRYSMRTDRSRPIRLRAVAERRALYQDAARDRKERGGRALLEMEITGSGDAARFSENARVDP